MSPTLPLSRERLLELIPHAGAMCLLDCVSEFAADDIVCEATSHRDPCNPLRSADGLSALHLVEYAAQAMAAHGALNAGTRPQPGKLAALRQIELHVATIHDIAGKLTVHAHRRLARAEGSLYDFRVSGDGRLLCEGRIAIVLD